MQVEIFSLCDAATADGGKLNMLGVFDTLWAPQVPVTHPQCTIALRMRFWRLERGDHKVTVNFIDIDGKHVIPTARGVLRIRFPETQRSGSANLILNLQGLRLERYGEYSIDLSVDERAVASIPLFVRAREK